MQAPVFGGFMRVVSKRGHVTHGPASILQAPVFGGFMRVVIGRGYETHGPTDRITPLLDSGYKKMQTVLAVSNTK